MRGANEAELPLDKVARQEQELFEQATELKDVPEDCKGLSALVRKLTRLQVERIREYLPTLKAEVGHPASAAPQLLNLQSS